MQFSSIVRTWRIPRFIYIIFILLLSLCIIFGIREWRRNVVIRIVDGDTFILRDGRQIRLLGIDAPEKGRCMADRAEVRLSQLVLGKYVRLKDQTHDSYGRILANVIATESFPMWMKYLYSRFISKDGYHGLAMINRVMVEEGLGKYQFSGTQYSQVLKLAHEVATTGKLGVYSSVCRQIETKRFDCQIKGNIRDGKKTYHFPTCVNYADTIIDTSFGDQWFCTEKEALAAGFSRASGCPMK
jgi:endonuclease YncB( thermonuclease family)